MLVIFKIAFNRFLLIGHISTGPKGRHDFILYESRILTAFFFISWNFKIEIWCHYLLHCFFLLGVVSVVKNVQDGRIKKQVSCPFLVSLCVILCYPINQFVPLFFSSLKREALTRLSLRNSQRK